MLKARRLGALAPVVYNLELPSACIFMERVQGSNLRQLLQAGALDAPAQAELMGALGRSVARLHDGGLVHGDLTTSNVMVRQGDGALVLVDFGLSYNSTLPEDKSVDLYVLERAITSAHSDQGGGQALFDAVLAAYKGASKLWCPTLNRYAEVRMRGRKRTMVG